MDPWWKVVTPRREVREGPLAIVKTQDPNKSHPLRQKDVINSVQTLHSTPVTSYVFPAIVWRHDLASKPQYCWKATEGILTRYPHDTVAFLKSLSEGEVLNAIEDYRRHLRTKNKPKAIA